jgi:hypothetical protein
MCLSSPCCGEIEERRDRGWREDELKTRNNRRWRRRSVVNERRRTKS